MVAEIGRALERKKLLRLSYKGLKDTSPKHRRVQPKAFFHRSDDWYLEAWDFDSDKLKSFRLNRVEDVLILPEAFHALALDEEVETHPWSFGDEEVEVVLQESAGAGLMFAASRHPERRARTKAVGIVPAVCGPQGVSSFCPEGDEPVMAVLAPRLGGELEGVATPSIRDDASFRPEPEEAHAISLHGHVGDGLCVCFGEEHLGVWGGLVDQQCRRGGSLRRKPGFAEQCARYVARGQHPQLRQRPQGSALADLNH